MLLWAFLALSCESATFAPPEHIVEAPAIAGPDTFEFGVQHCWLVDVDSSFCNQGHELRAAIGIESPPDGWSKTPLFCSSKLTGAMVIYGRSRCLEGAVSEVTEKRLRAAQASGAL